MKLREKWIVSLVFILFVMLLTPHVTQATVIGNTFFYSATWNDQSVQENNGPILRSTASGLFRVTVFSITDIGGDDAYEYNYNGYEYVGFPVHFDHNDTVTFQNNKVDFHLYTMDSNSNNRSESTDLQVYPTRSVSHPGRYLFVNPVWSTHFSDWNDSVTLVELNPTVNQGLTSFSNPQDGTFSFTIVVNIEDTALVGGDPQDVNGTHRFTFSSSYDSDGVLQSWRFSQRIYVFNENYTLDQTLISSITRTSGVGLGPTLLGSTFVSILLVAGVTLPIGLVIGLYIGRRRWASTK